jgi:sortase A
VRTRIGLALLGLGIALVAWTGVMLAWGDPFTSLYTRHEQQELAKRLERVERNWRSSRDAGRSRTLSAARARGASTTSKARRFERGLRDGAPFGRIVIPRIHLRMVVVEGTSAGDLRRGPGHYDAESGQATSVPGLGAVVAIAGHRTTYLQPFRHIDELRPGDRIYLRMPYGTFRYTVLFQKVVDPSDWSILRPRPYEKLVLTACHPLYSASHRLAVFARLDAGPKPAQRQTMLRDPDAQERTALLDGLATAVRALGADLPGKLR